MVSLGQQTDNVEERDQIKLMALETVKMNNTSSVFCIVPSSVAVGFTALKASRNGSHIHLLKETVFIEESHWINKSFTIWKLLTLKIEEKTINNDTYKYRQLIITFHKMRNFSEACVNRRIMIFNFLVSSIHGRLD